MRSTKVLTLIVVLALALFGVVALSACGGDSTPPAASTDDSAAGTETTGAAAGELEIGVVNSTTGENALNGAEQKWAYEKAIADINAKGGVDVGGTKMQIKLVFADDKARPKVPRPPWSAWPRSKA